MRTGIKFLVVAIVLTFLAACNGGGGNDSPRKPPTPTPSSNILPLNISVNDLNNNPLPNNTIDVFKIGQVLKYKLTFTNPNNFNVTRPQSHGGTVIFQDLNWAYAHHKDLYPGALGEITGRYYKTTNTDDCLNVTTIERGQSCSFYTIARNTLNTTTQEDFTYPLEYVFAEASNPTNKLVVQQCQKTGVANPLYDCSNENKPGYKNQFIKYRLVSTTTPFPQIYVGGNISNNGDYSAVCTQDDPTTCTKNSIAYNSNNNSLTFTKLTEFTMATDLPNASAVLTADGTTFFGALLKKGGDFTLINSINPSQYLGSYGSGSNRYLTEVQGLDNSIIVNNTGLFGAIKYFPTQNKILSIKVDGSFDTQVYGVTTDGTLIIDDAGGRNLRCANSTDGLNYTSRPMTNFVFPNSYEGNKDLKVIQEHHTFYGYQDMTLNDANGTSYITGASTVRTYFKINANKNDCSIALANASSVNSSDILFNTGIFVYGSYVNVLGKLTSAANSAIGVNE